MDVNNYQCNQKRYRKMIGATPCDDYIERQNKVVPSSNEMHIIIIFGEKH